MTPPSSPTSVRRLSTSVSPPTPRPRSPTSSEVSSPCSPSLSPPASVLRRRRRNTYCYSGPADPQSKVSSLLVPPPGPAFRHLRRASAPQLVEIQSLARAGIKPHNILNLLTASESMENVKNAF